MLYFEDFTVGRSFDCGTFRLSEDDIVEFAQKYDPQRFHTDREAAKHTLYGKLIASGWHTASMAMRLIVDAVFGQSTSMGSPGLTELGWKKPVLPDVDMRVVITVEEARQSKSKPEIGFVLFRCEVIEPNGDVALNWRGNVMFGTRG
jgi:acyl dehydratase